MRGAFDADGACRPKSVMARFFFGGGVTSAFFCDKKYYLLDSLYDLHARLP